MKTTASHEFLLGVTFNILREQKETVFIFLFLFTPRVSPLIFFYGVFKTMILTANFDNTFIVILSVAEKGSVFMPALL